MHTKHISLARVCRLARMTQNTCMRARIGRKNALHNRHFHLLIHPSCAHVRANEQQGMGTSVYARTPSVMSNGVCATLTVKRL
jgi:hypothetical protein